MMISDIITSLQYREDNSSYKIIMWMMLALLFHKDTAKKIGEFLFLSLGFYGIMAPIIDNGFFPCMSQHNNGTKCP